VCRQISLHLARFARDDEIAKALRVHREWMGTMGKTLEAAKANLQESLQMVPSAMVEDVKNEVKLCRNRMYALKLVLGESDKVDEDDEDLDKDIVICAMQVGIVGARSNHLEHKRFTNSRRAPL
jgi:hypothetical protein